MNYQGVYQQPNIPYYQQTSSNVRQMQPQTTYQQSPFLKGRLVSSFEEAKAAGIDFDGSIFYFPDLANRRIYTKQINLDGTSTLNVYEFKELPVEQPQQAFDASLYVTKDELAKIVEALRTDLQEALKPKITF